MTHGGKRTGSGRPRGSNIWGESTKAIRLPISKIPAVKAFLENGGNASACPLYSSHVRAGFPSPADDYIESYLDLNAHLIKHPAATFFVTASDLVTRTLESMAQNQLSTKMSMMKTARTMQQYGIAGFFRGTRKDNSGRAESIFKP